MWSEFISTNTKKLFGLIFSTNSEKNAILDPFSCMVRLAILNFKPNGTKISFAHNKISYHEPCILQGTIRWSQGDNREDLHNLFQPIKKALLWYDYNDSKIEFIFKLSERGINKLEGSYTYNSLITHSLEHYRDYINKHYQNQNGDKEKRIKKDLTTDNSENKDNKIFKELRELWSDNEINIIFNILKEMKDNRNKNNCSALIDAIESILTHKEYTVRDIIIQNTTMLE